MNKKTKKTYSLQNWICKNLPIALILVISIPASLAFTVFSAFSIAGSHPAPSYIAILSLITGNFLLIVAFWKKKVLKYTPICLVIVVACILWDTLFWVNHNNQMCLDLRSDPNCINDGGWSCKDSDRFGNMVTGSSICKGIDLFK